MKINSKKERVLAEMEKMFNNRLDYVMKWFEHIDTMYNDEFKAKLKMVERIVLNGTEVGDECNRNLYLLCVKSHAAEQVMLQRIFNIDDDE